LPNSTAGPGKNCGSILIPTAASCCWKIAALVERRELPTVVYQRNDACWPLQLQKF